jgi:hypothetical protein
MPRGQYRPIPHQVIEGARDALGPDLCSNSPVDVRPTGVRVALQIFQHQGAEPVWRNPFQGRPLIKTCRFPVVSVWQTRCRAAAA